MLNLAVNGGFSRGLYLWAGSGTIERSLGYPRLNCARLAAGQSLGQAVSIGAETYYTLHYFYRLTTGATLTVGYGAITNEHTGAPLDVWREGVLAFSAEAGEENGSIVLAAAGGLAYVDSVSLLWGALAKSRAEIAGEVAARIRTLAAEKGLVATPGAGGPEGDYTAAIDEALRANGAMNDWGDVDIGQLSAGNINAAIEGATGAMMELIRTMYALDVDVTLGPRSESRSQISKNLADLIGGGSGGGVAGTADRSASSGRLGRDSTGWQR